MRIKPGMLLVARPGFQGHTAFWGECVLVVSMLNQSFDIDEDDHERRRRWCSCVGYFSDVGIGSRDGGLKLKQFNHHSEFLLSYYEACLTDVP